MKALNKSLPCNAKYWKKDIEFFSKINVKYIVKLARREVNASSDKVVTICENIDKVSFFQTYSNSSEKKVLRARKRAFVCLL